MTVRLNAVKSDKGQAEPVKTSICPDAYVDYDGDVGDMPFTIRAGRQVINWGEATFIPGGNSAFIDVAAIRNQRSLAAGGIYGSIALTQDFTLEAYVGGWDDYRLDAGGTCLAALTSSRQALKWATRIMSIILVAATVQAINSRVMAISPIMAQAPKLSAY